jgi:hypothetical protein
MAAWLAAARAVGPVDPVGRLWFVAVGLSNGTATFLLYAALGLDSIAVVAPRAMKMGTTASPWRYDAAAAATIRPDSRRRTTILRYASWAAVLPISLVVRLTFGCGHFDQSRERRVGPEGGVTEITAAGTRHLPASIWGTVVNKRQRRHAVPRGSGFINP